MGLARSTKIAVGPSNTSNSNTMNLQEELAAAQTEIAQL